MVKVTYVAELGSGVGSYMCRAMCTRCVPTWHGPAYKENRGPAGVVEARRRATIDVLRHCDRVHAGRLTGR